MDIKYMQKAIELAKLGEGFTNPNPLVGAVIVKDGRIIGEGYHERYGGFHAERNAIKNATEPTDGADMYVTLEPCSHHGKQPPCCEAVVEAGIKNVYIGSQDPNPLVSGKGIGYLKSHGVSVITDVLKDECDAINKIFFHYITTKRPYVIMKTAMSIDGKCASYTGDSKWISNELSREDTHRTRKRVAGIMVGINTVMADNPMLNCRLDNPKNPVRIICDSKLRIPLDCKIVKTANDIPTYIATVSTDTQKIQKLETLGVKIIRTSGKRVKLNELMCELGGLGIDSVLVEGGAELHASFLEAGLVNKLEIYIAPKIIGGKDAKTVVGGNGVELVSDAYMFKNPKITMFGDDIKIEYEKGE
ncbi:MAG: bifunctional diaminohydroxyphosphoribosylaminopyrimidine deaminase/5-amino-6-(5-phosphoribosylamino)uracil reductase RibD [Clostridia bacterium]|nr:bifunctional diaminohydroxyphosphoribosylaminopyrimidine deaminase/5-amino-6-(5-phosphoribosylamino)uracil reductase RibD [Clostridia bacterium]